MGLVAGIDCSTQSTKALIVDSDSGEVVAEGRGEHVVTGTDGARETHPEVWWDALQASLAGTGVAGEVEAISIAGQQHGLVVQDEAGRPLRPAVLWNDVRAAPDAARLVEELGGPEVWAAHTGIVPVASFTIAKWAWLRRTDPETAAAAAMVRLPHDHLTERLTGRGATDRGDASGTGWWSQETGGYTERTLSLPSVDLSPELLPDLLAHDAVAGEVTTAAAAALGLRAGTLVGPGTGDNMAAALGLGLRPGTPVISLGTSGTAYAVSDDPVVDPTGTVAGFADATGRFLPLACTLNCTLAVDRLAELLGLDRADAAERTDCVVLPYLDGERTPNLPHAAGTIAGVRHDTTPQQILRAAYEGAVEALLTALELIDEAGASIDADAPVLLIGGGARGRVWREVVATLSGRPVVVPDAGELVAYGAAAQAAAVLAGEDPLDVARHWGGDAGERHEPSSVRRDRLEHIHEVRRRLHEVNAQPL